MRTRDESGAAAVEFALVLPILIVLVFGIINFGVVFAQQLSLSNAARQGARLAAVEGNDCTAVDDEVRGNVATLALQASDVGVAITRGAACSGATQPCDGASAGESVRVQVTYTSPLLVPIPPFPDQIDLEGIGEFRCEYW